MVSKLKNMLKRMSHRLMSQMPSVRNLGTGYFGLSTAK